MKDWYKGKTTSGDITKTYRLKLQALELTTKGDTNMYINEFIRFKNQLEDMNEGEHPATLMDQFLDQIKTISMKYSHQLKDEQWEDSGDLY